MRIFREVSVVVQRGNQDRILKPCHVFSLVGLLLLSFSSVAAGSNSRVTDTQPNNVSHQVSLCDWQRDYDYFTETSKTERVESLPCEQAVLQSSGSRVADSLHEGIVSHEKRAFEAELRTMVKGYPIEAMVSTIATYDRDIAGLIVGIAKKESNWGKRVPRTTSGDDCFNYWGYKGAGARGIAMGHGCFGESAEAVHAIGGRLQELVALRHTSEPANLTIWKCGSSCASHSPESVKKWISDVDLYFRAIARK